MCTSLFRSTHFLFPECYSLSLRLLGFSSLKTNWHLPSCHYYSNLSCVTNKQLFGSTCPLYYDKQLLSRILGCVSFLFKVKKYCCLWVKLFLTKVNVDLFTCQNKDIFGSSKISNSLLTWASHWERGWRLLVYGQKLVQIQNLIKSSEKWHTFALNIQAFNQYS